MPKERVAVAGVPALNSTADTAAILIVQCQLWITFSIVVAGVRGNAFAVWLILSHIMAELDEGVKLQVSPAAALPRLRRAGKFLVTMADIEIGRAACRGRK